ncbi:MAG TPA: type II toxin-antitoxin system death-on-curing family toxin [Paracoccus sp. (in: a-proteobacteria)]|uniref:type II toxin-antitoxin system death-on-curing family toxin n=1 Tax=uncultured Paracoccus sp. TaxID=189685 RepID=UPI0026017E9D|nr:type II toxin-antitoxin system death-on-curing family toxin [uncultured Paracoccus sp.]HMQ41789.1 type II toxin-antitoxin system death-on-curing family toxin [Paracoccus sp. (in: a-proteobacteria)]HMR36657.1 type II toxin-antitoxin system death-on-curing family toxin [Paracoccus sp. (in: a-proteobacteria)]
MFTLTADTVEQIHDDLIGPGELAGRARDKSLEAALARVENRLAYGMIADVCDLAAAYAMAISRGHCFNDGNKRTAFRSMQICLLANGIRLRFETEEVGQKIIALAQGQIDDGDLADWLRAHP